MNNNNKNKKPDPIIQTQKFTGLCKEHRPITTTTTTLNTEV